MMRTTQQLFDEFDEAAKAWGWAEDQASADEVQKAHRRYARARKALLREIQRLRAVVEGQRYYD